ncbi:hypothetical protein GQR93_09660 [Lentilactobacillus hilgardii]|uniref:Holin n=1 Tax=Lentilactobacillus hilgardii TaxID=1588 RepID=A0A6P1EB48_LENHI|nr:holin [Lentilactobacillus hilgardii]QHB52441.1 hypothetical protein GQR93_09660 [Lentilactobacillus hilgardii]
MNFIQQLNLGTTAEMSLIFAVVFCITQALKTTVLNNKWLPWISMIVGVFAGLLAAIINADSHYLSSAVLGLLIGGFTSGLFDGFKGFSTNKEDKNNGL